MAGQASDIPVGSQFAPSLLDLRSFLEAAVEHSGDRDALASAAWAKPVRIGAISKPPTARRKLLPLEAAVQYGLFEATTYRATELVSHLLTTTGGSELHDEFARHILLRLGGLRVVEAAQQMALQNRKVTGDSLAGELTDQGFVVGVHNTAINSLRMWLAKAGVFSPRGWEVDSSAKSRLVGLDDAQIAALAGLSEHQRAFAIALCRINPTRDCPAADVRDLAETIVHGRMDRGNLPKTFLEPLKKAGLIEYRTRGTASGKTSVLRTTTRFKSELLQPFLESAVKSLDGPLTDYFLRAPADIYAELDSRDPNVKGEALEAFAVHIMRLLGLRFVKWRKRAREETGQAEVDVVMAGLLGGLFTRWQVQCKNKSGSRVTLEDVAKEVGLTPLTKATHIMILANCEFTADARVFAVEAMRHSALSVFLVGKKEFEMIKVRPAALAGIIREQSEAMRHLERPGLDWVGR